MSEEPGERAARELLAEFGTRLDPAYVCDEVRRAARELEGQTRPGGATELIHRLARTRLLSRLDPVPGADDAAPDPGDAAAACRARMVERLRDAGIRDERVLAAMGAVPRERFVRPELAAEAYDDTPLDIGHDQTISAPWAVAFGIASLGLPQHARVLEVGTGSGYGAAVLARCAAEVVTVERDPELAAAARDLLARLAPDVEVRTGDGVHAGVDRAPYDGILVTAMASGRLPRPLVRQLAPGGTLVCPVGTNRVGTLVRWRDGAVEELAPVTFVPLVTGD
ncbi:protein-L-isoaspartate(D-aspartate) O-methyltransferase [Pseudonocardia benzenivorans]|uniref:Protein-L-isoaspartate O-methyltransferase n=1 Tax=Pseudonocardia benzenivorans TaxID=228005 RepID=A0ABW3VHX3_9PSEU